MGADYKIATGPGFFSVWIKQLCWTIFPAPRQYGVTKQTVVFCFVLVLFLSPTRTKSTTSNEESIETAEKNIKTTRYIANEAKIGCKNLSDYSL